MKTNEPNERRTRNNPSNNDRKVPPDASQEYVSMLCALYRDIASAYPAQYEVDNHLDITRIIERSSDEGMSFLTKTLPSIAKAIDKCLATGTPLNIPHFERRKDSVIPRFLGWLIERVFDSKGTELANSDPYALVHLRQLLYLFYKLEMPYTDIEVNRVIDDFVSVDESLNTAFIISEPDDRKIMKRAQQLAALVLGGCATDKLNPKHGPGSVATGERNTEKHYFKRWYSHLDAVYKYDEYMYMNASHQEACLTAAGLHRRNYRGQLQPWEDLDHSTAKVVLVPKDSRGPRLISMEPPEIQWLQQGQCERLVSRFESHWLTAGHVNFTSQDINRYLAWFSSMNGCTSPLTLGPHANEDTVFEPVKRARPLSQDLVTIDMKEASDRVSLQLVYYLFPSNWVIALEATRSDSTVLPDGRIVKMNKFAPMGSAVCFPVESFIFFVLAVSSVVQQHPNMSSAKAARRVWVYGDDIICHREDYPGIRRTLELVQLKLNEQKSCTQGFFRESCGVDAYKGIIVTPLRIKKRVTRRLDGQSIMAYVAYSNAAYRYGYTQLASKIENLVQASTLVPFTTVDRGLVQFVRPLTDVAKLNKRFGIRTRFNSRLHILEAFGFTPRALLVEDIVVTTESYLSRFASKYLRRPINPPSEDKAKGPFWGIPQLCDSGLEPDQYAVPRRVSSRRGWTQITI